MMPICVCNRRLCRAMAPEQTTAAAAARPSHIGIVMCGVGRISAEQRHGGGMYVREREVFDWGQWNSQYQVSELAG
jgi:hypothetical protein